MIISLVINDPDRALCAALLQELSFKISKSFIETYIFHPSSTGVSDNKC